MQKNCVGLDNDGILFQSIFYQDEVQPIYLNIHISSFIYEWLERGLNTID